MEWTNINTEKRRLDLARLDLDAAKSKVRGARTPEAMQQNEQKVGELMLFSLSLIVTFFLKNVSKKHNIFVVKLL